MDPAIAGNLASFASGRDHGLRDGSPVLDGIGGTEWRRRPPAPAPRTAQPARGPETPPARVDGTGRTPRSPTARRTTPGASARAGSAEDRAPLSAADMTRPGGAGFIGPWTRSECGRAGSAGVPPVALLPHRAPGPGQPTCRCCGCRPRPATARSRGCSRPWPGPMVGPPSPSGRPPVRLRRHGGRA